MNNLYYVVVRNAALGERAKLLYTARDSYAAESLAVEDFGQAWEPVEVVLICQTPDVVSVEV